MSLTMTPNPSHCPKFVVNVFKAGSGKCRDCGLEWHQHEGVIDKNVAEKFRSIWSNAKSPSARAPLTSNAAIEKSMREMKEDKRKLLLQSARTARGGESDWMSGNGTPASHPTDNEEDEFKYYSREEFLAKERGGPSGSASPSVSGSTSNRSLNSRPLKVVNLLNFGAQDTPNSDRAADSGRHLNTSIEHVVSPLPIIPTLPLIGPAQMLQIEKEFLEKNELIERLQKEAAESSRTLEKTSQEIAQMAQEMREKSLLVDSLRAKAERESQDESEFHRLRSQVGDAQKAVAQKEAEIEQLRAKNIIEQQDRELDHMSQITELEFLLTERNGRIAQLEEERMRLGEELAERRDAHVNEEYEAVKGSNNRLSSELAAMSDKLESEIATKTALLSEINLLSSQLESEKSSVAVLWAQLESVTVSHSALKSEVAAMTAELESERTAINVISGELELEKNSKNTLMFEMNLLQERLESSANELHSGSGEKQQIQLALDEALAELELERAAASSKEAEMSQLRELLGRVRSDGETAAKDFNDRLERLNSEINTLKSAINEKEATIARMDLTSVDSAKLRSELEYTRQKLHESVSRLGAEKEQFAITQNELQQAKYLIEELKVKLSKTTTDLMSTNKQNHNIDQIANENQRYLQAISDVNYVLARACSKYLTPGATEITSRNIALEEIGSEDVAVHALEANVRAAMRMIENVTEKSEFIERENSKLQKRVADFETMNSSLKERLNQPFISRLFQPLIGCVAPEPDANTFSAVGRTTTVNKGPPTQSSMHTRYDHSDASV